MHPWPGSVHRAQMLARFFHVEVGYRNLDLVVINKAKTVPYLIKRIRNNTIVHVEKIPGNIRRQNTWPGDHSDLPNRKTCSK